MAGGGHEAGGGHGPFAVPAEQRERAGIDAGAVGCQGAELEVGCAGDVPGAVLGVLADVQDRAGELAGRDQLGDGANAVAATLAGHPTGDLGRGRRCTVATEALPPAPAGRAFRSRGMWPCGTSGR